MRALRALTAILLAGLAAAGGSRASAEVPATLPEVCAEPGTTLTPVDPPSRSDTFLASSSTTSLAGTVEEGARTRVPAARILRPIRTGSLLVPAARVAAVVRDRLEFARVLDIARLGYFSIGGTSPPSYRI